MDNNTNLLKFKVWDMEMGGWITRHTKVKYARKSKENLIKKHGFKPDQLRIVHYTEKHKPYRYLSIARVHQSIFGY